jgi:hypothetical protein
MSAVLVLVYVVIGVAVVIAAGMSFFVKRHNESVTPADGWQRTDEVFVDPTTDRRMRVWVDPVDRSRHYVQDTT